MFDVQARRRSSFSYYARQVSPTNQGFHYNQNAETYMLVAEALGKRMLKLYR